MATFTRNVDTLIAGAGSAGLTAFNELRQSELSVLLCDGGPLGTTCARAGCMPSKALIEISRKAHWARSLYENRLLSLDVDPQFNIPRVMEQVRGLRDHFTGLIEKQIQDYGEDFIQSNVHFKGPDLAETEDGTQIRFESAIVAVGSSPIVPASFKGQPGIYTSDTIFDLREPITSLDVLGCGVVGLEVAQAISRLGADVRVYCEDLDLNFLPDDELREIYRNQLEKDLSFVIGFEVHHTGKGKHFQFEDKTQTYEACLLAMGRKSNIDTLKIGDSHSILESGIKSHGLPFYFVGDANSLNPTVHDAVMEGKRAASMIRGDSPIKSQPLQFQIVFTDPQVAILERKGAQKEELKAEALYLNKQGRLILAGENYGCIKIFYEPRTQIIHKAYIVSSQAEHLAHYLYPLLQREIRLKDFKNTVFYHPTVYEIFNAIREDKMPRPNKNKKPFQNPENKISDTKAEFFDRDYGRKVDHDTMSDYSKADMINQKEKNRPRNSI